MFGWMLPKGARQATLSKMNMGGMGTAMLKDLMKKKNVASLPQMIDMAGQLGVRVYVCEMSMDLMGFKREVAHNVLAHHNGIVNQQSDAE